MTADESSVDTDHMFEMLEDKMKVSRENYDFNPSNLDINDSCPKCDMHVVDEYPFKPDDDGIWISYDFIPYPFERIRFSVYFCSDCNIYFGSLEEADYEQSITEIILRLTQKYSHQMDSDKAFQELCDKREIIEQEFL